MAAPAYRAAGLPTLNTTTTSVTITKPTGTISGDLLIACVTNGSANAAPATVPSGWALLVGQGGTTWWGGIYYLVAGGSEPADYTWDGFTDSCTGVMIAVSGADTGSPFDGFNAAANVGTSTPGCSGITTTVADTLIVGACAEDDNNGLSTWACATDPTTLTERADFGSSGGGDTGAGLATGTKATAGATGAFSLAISAARDSSAFLLAVKAPSSGVSGTLTGVLPALTGSLTGAVSVTGDLAGTLPALTGALTGDVAGPVTGVLAAQLPALTGSLTGVVTVSGELTGTLPALTGSTTGQVTVTAALSATLPALTGAAAGQVTVAGQIAGTLPTLTGQMAGQVTVSGGIAGVLPALTGQIAGIIPTSGAIAGVLPALRSTLAGTVEQDEEGIASISPASRALAGITPSSQATAAMTSGSQPVASITT